MPNELNPCRVCGLSQPGPPWGETDTDPSFLICACCGTEFGYEDTMPSAARAKRQRWIDGGMPWFEERERPANWDATAQLAQVPERFR